MDDLIRPDQQRLRNRQAQQLGGLQIDHQLELGGLLDGEIGGFGILQDLVHVGRTKRARGAGRVGLLSGRLLDQSLRTRE